ncbi:MAG TPA: transporter substrate-binding domain-containing protein [Methylomirabilota bacterium]|jgi:membrane-bound lytic murein transglycosylase F|nr:transporter substrate-binding domain-containing protein [Methylomirabilota bacterium]
MTTVSWRLGVLCVVVAIVWGGVSRLQPDTFPALTTPGMEPLVTMSAPSHPTFSNPQTLIAEHLQPILVKEAPPPGASWKEIKRRGVIKFLIPHSAASYFLYRGEQMGFEYELALEFARELGVELEVITPPPGIELTAWLEEGRGDIAAGIAIGAESEPDAFRTSVSYLDTTAELLTRRPDTSIPELAALSGKSIAIQPDALYAAPVLASFGTRPLSPSLTMVKSEESIGGAIRMMAYGQAAAALMTAPLADLAFKLYPGQLRTAFTFSQTVHMVWAVRPENAGLLAVINAFLDRSTRSGLRKILFEKYFLTAAHLSDRAHTQELTLISKRLTRYDRLIARHAEEAGMDWRFVAALIFEESRFNHERTSQAGAYGLMQITPIAAQYIGVKNYSHPTNNIEAGIKYLKFLTGQFPDGSPKDRLALVLASYVMGLGHVEDARRLARRLGYDPDCWEASMERVIPLLEKRKYYRQTQYGAAQGKEAVRYVNAILKRYSLYSQYVSRELPVVTERRTKGSRQAASAAG